MDIETDIRFLFTVKNTVYASKIAESRKHEHKITSCFIKIPSNAYLPNGNKTTNIESNIEIDFFISALFSYANIQKKSGKVYSALNICNSTGYKITLL